MNKDLIAFIDLCLIDGAISEKERKVIFAKANIENSEEQTVYLTSLALNWPLANTFITMSGGWSTLKVL